MCSHKRLAKAFGSSRGIWGLDWAAGDSGRSALTASSITRASISPNKDPLPVVIQTVFSCGAWRSSQPKFELCFLARSRLIIPRRDFSPHLWWHMGVTRSPRSPSPAAFKVLMLLIAGPWGPRKPGSSWVGTEVGVGNAPFHTCDPVTGYLQR